MSLEEPTLDTREKELENRIQMLEKHLERLTSQRGDEVAAAPIHGPASPVVKELSAEEMPELSEEILGWASRNAILPRHATVCFLMVIALVLRTITDGCLVNKLLRSGLGMGYATALAGTSTPRIARLPRFLPPAALC